MQKHPIVFCQRCFEVDLESVSHMHSECEWQSRRGGRGAKEAGSSVRGLSDTALGMQLHIPQSQREIKGREAIQQQPILRPLGEQEKETHLKTPALSEIHLGMAI